MHYNFEFQLPIQSIIIIIMVLNTAGHSLIEPPEKVSFVINFLYFIFVRGNK